MKKLIAILMGFMISFATINVIPNYSVYANDATDAEKESASNQGKYFGIVDGYNRGITNFKDKTKYAYTHYYTKDLDAYITSEEYAQKSALYMNSFKSGYKSGYIEAYDLGDSGEVLEYEELRAFASSGEYVPEVVSADGASYGDSLGTIAGEFNAVIDYNSNIRFKGNESLARFKQTKSLTARFYLTEFGEDYKNDFTLAFEDSYIIAYEQKYMELVNTLAEQNIVYTPINNFAGDFSFTLDLDTTGAMLTFEFPTGSLYGDGYIGATKDRNPVSYDTSRFKFVDTDFIVDTFNLDNYTRSEYIDPIKEFKMSIDHNVGSDNIGIYEYKKGAWQYIFTDINEGTVSHTFPAKMYEGGKYCLFVEPSYTKFSDTYLSPFYNEIYTYGRRGAIYKVSDKFYPTSNITRGDLSYIINGILNPNNYSTTSKNFTDIPYTSLHKTSVDFVSKNGYMNGVSDTTFNLSGNITYTQLDIIIERTLGKPFDMNAIFTKMRNEKLHKSKGESNLNSFVTKEEAVYILYQAME